MIDFKSNCLTWLRIDRTQMNEESTLDQTISWKNNIDLEMNTNGSIFLDSDVMWCRSWFRQYLHLLLFLLFWISHWESERQIGYQNGQHLPAAWRVKPGEVINVAAIQFKSGMIVLKWTRILVLEKLDYRKKRKENILLKNDDHKRSNGFGLIELDVDISSVGAASVDWEFISYE